LRLFAVACCRRIWHLLSDQRRRAVEVTEAYADGLVQKQDFHAWGWLRDGAPGVVALVRAADAAEAMASCGEGMAAQEAAASDGELKALWEAAFRAAWDSGDSPSEALTRANAAVAGAPGAAAWVARQEAARHQERAAQTAVLRDVFGPLPFRPVPLEPSWLTPPVVGIALHVYEERDFEALPVLSDALEEAGCTNLDLLQHCRQQGRLHVRGCFVTDLLLNKG
jgi:hypothetical protein